jgi:hypothetical protein
MEITKKEFDELYGDVEVEFTTYWKYSFAFEGKTESGDEVYLSVGGCADDIYRMDVTAGEKVKVRDLYARFASVCPAGKTHSESIHTYSEYY